ncbi:hypothetical protein MHY87_01425 [Microvirga sp. ACRRW]|uniref:hypothetical protein n=1 Tax=Microvirga sp. ACRRW TaxID=2918205 RepID=UPI001EF6118A|nr:hypothetical protein [Microvirga sp. ACRRW]MCG7391568.1 hypothetical protein [Microvirga sp. ACRRW]
MNHQITVLQLLKRARALVDAGQHAGIIDAISALKAEANGPKRDQAYYALLETASESRGEADMTALSSASRDAAMALLDATIKRMTQRLH